MLLSEKKTILSRILGSGKPLNGGTQMIYKCPFCHHHKRKLQIHLELDQFHCWICGVKGRSLTTLLRKLKVDKETIDKFRSKSANNSSAPIVVGSDKELITLPKEFNPLYIRSSDPAYKHALGYLFKRGLTIYDILKYNIGYCTSGPYSGMIIIPSYDESGTLNFFTGRSFYPDSDGRKHKNPSVSKNIIGFESTINWKLPVVIVEGAFDAIAVKRNAIPLFGKKILSTLKNKILTEKVKTVYVCLDMDAKQDSLKLSQYFTNHGVQVHFVNLHQKDPSDIGFRNMRDVLRETKILDFGDIIRLKLSL